TRPPLLPQGATDLEKHLELLELENKSLKRRLASGGTCEGACACACSQVSRVKVRGKTTKKQACPKTDSRSRTARRPSYLWVATSGPAPPRRTPRAEDRTGPTPRRTSPRLERDFRTATPGTSRAAKRRRRRRCRLALRMPRVCREVIVRCAHQTAEGAESDDWLRVQNALLQEQVCAQRRMLRELETQLQRSQRTCAQLRTQVKHQIMTDLEFCGYDSNGVRPTFAFKKVLRHSVALYDGEMARARRQLDAELLSLKEEKERVVREAFVRAESQMKAVHDNLAGVRSKLAGLHPALRTLTADYNTLKKQVHHFPAMLRNAIDDAKREICRAIGDVSATNQKLVDKYKREMNLRKKIHNQLVQLKGNIRVLCRVRPVAGGEEAEGVLTFDPDDDGVLHLSDKGKVTTFDLDKVFGPEATQEEGFSEVEALVTSCVDGFHVCIFAYGQTGSGKTYTMEGAASDPGLNQRALRLLFSRVADKSPEWEFHICVSMLEIYNETLRDLLGDQPAADKLDIKMNPDGSGQLYVPGLTRVAVRTVDDVNQVLEAGRASRATACTDLNERSSRSHALLVVSVAGLNGTTGSRTQGKLNLVDLAGSERVGRSGAEGGRLREARHINKSLSALGDVMDALRRKRPHVPFRNSRLTFLLQDSLQGDSKTLMMVQVSPVAADAGESLCSLKFAQRVRSVELNASKRPDSRSASSSPTPQSLEVASLVSRRPRAPFGPNSKRLEKPPPPPSLRLFFLWL
uniref:Kinesin-like protein n=1 Tax=Hippocampus comes TaxID=109280 RepID=A0A3Q2YR78_HIPCM